MVGDWTMAVVPEYTSSPGSRGVRPKKVYEMSQLRSVNILSIFALIFLFFFFILRGFFFIMKYAPENISVQTCV